MKEIASIGFLVVVVGSATQGSAVQLVVLSANQIVVLPTLGFAY